ncbi:MAG: SWIM zinc finger family protein [Actinobacteria bacterium]|nr:SWIM zinc finger family protein [Actinomycetota bacterium]
MTDATIPAQVWQIEQVFALAPKPSSIAAAQPLATPTRWVGTGCDDRAVWGRFIGGSAEPYECVVDHVAVAYRCSCPSRVLPCKHSLGLLLLWVRGLVPAGQAPGFAATWLAKRAEKPEAVAVLPSKVATTASDLGSDAASAAPPDRDPKSTRDDRVARMAAGLGELNRWLEDRLRTGLGDPVLANYSTWDGLAGRLIDAQVGGLANRVRRLAGMVGANPDWHEHVLAELGALHLLASAGGHLGSLPTSLADSVAAAIGWQVRQADVLAGVPHTDHWAVMGRSDNREDRIEVRRLWLRGEQCERWALALSFAAYGQSLDDSLAVGSVVEADLFRYPGALGLRALVGPRHSEPRTDGDALRSQLGAAGSVAAACAQVGMAVAVEPWLERYPVCVLAAPARHNGRWVLTDATGSVPLVDQNNRITPGVGQLLACSAGRPVAITAEWTPLGMVPLTVHLADRAIDIGPTADRSFLAATA